MSELKKTEITELALANLLNEIELLRSENSSIKEENKQLKDKNKKLRFDEEYYQKENDRLKEEYKSLHLAMKIGGYKLKDLEEKE